MHGRNDAKSVSEVFQNLHSMDPTVRKTIQKDIPTTLKRSVRKIWKIWQTPRIEDDSLVN